MITTLEIDGIAIPTEAILEFDQEYDQLEARDLRRTADNSAVLRVTGDSKLVTTINGKGWAPPGLGSLDLGTTHTIRCAMPNSVSAAAASVTLPAARRSDTGHTPIGFAVVGDRLVETPITDITSNIALLTTVAGETGGYVVHYWPEIRAVVVRNTAKGSGKAAFDWVIEAEEV